MPAGSVVSSSGNFYDFHVIVYSAEKLETVLVVLKITMTDLSDSSFWFTLVRTRYYSYILSDVLVTMLYWTLYC